VRVVGANLSAGVLAAEHLVAERGYIDNCSIFTGLKV